MWLVRKIRNLIRCSPDMRRIYIEAFLSLARARFLVLLPFSRLAPSLGERMKETPFLNSDENRREIMQIAQAVQVMSRHTLWESACLVRAIAAMKMLERRAVSCTLYLGTRRDENGKMLAHAWLRTGGIYVTGAEVMHEFTVVGKFAKGR